MTGPLDFLYAGRPRSVAVEPQAGGALDYLYDKKKEPATPGDASTQQGFFDYSIKLAKNWFQVNGVQDKMELEKMAGGKFDYSTDEMQIKNAILASEQNGSGFGMAANDFVHFGAKMFHDVKAQLGQIISSPSQTADAITKDFPGFLGGVAKAFITPIGDYAEVSTGVKLTGEEITPLTPEDKADRIKNIVATGAMLAVGAGVAKGLGASSAALRGMVAAEEATLGASGLATSELMTTSRLTAKGALGRELLKNTAVAGASGAAYGLVRYANEEDQLAQTIINGVVMAPLGVAFETLALGKGTKERLSIARRAGDVATLRQAQAVFSNTLDAVVNNVEAMSTADDLATAVLHGALKTKGKDIIHIPGVSSERLSALASDLPKGFESVYRFDPSGDTGSILVYKKKYSGVIDKKFFAENGVVKDQIVSHGGEDLRVVDADGKGNVTLENTQNLEQRTVPRDEVRMPDNAKFGNPEVTIQKTLTAEEQLKYDSLERIANGLNVTRDLREIAHEQMELMRTQQVFKFGDLDRSNVLDRMYGEFKATAEKPPPGPIEQAKGLRADIATQLATAPDHLKPELTRQAEELEALIRKMETRTNDPAGFADAKGSRLVEQVPQEGTNWTGVMKEYFTSKKFNPESHDFLTGEFEKRLVKEAHGMELGDELDFINDVHRSLKETQAADKAAAGKIKRGTAEELVRHANTNGYSISDGGAGAFVVRDGASGNIMLRTNNMQDAMKFIDTSGQAPGVELDGNGVVTGRQATAGRPLVGAGRPINDPNIVYRFMGKASQTAKNLSSEQAIRFLDNFALITRNREYFTGLDTKYKTKLFENVFDKTQAARRVANAKIRPYYEKLQGIEKIVKGMSQGDRELIGQWMQTMTPDEVKARFKTRPLNPLESKMGEMIAAKNVDLEKVFQYRRALEQIDKDIPDKSTPELKQQFIEARDKAKEAFGIDDKHQEVTDTFNQILDMGKKDADLGAIVRLARSIQDGELSRPDFAAKHKMTFEHMRAGNQLEAMYKELAPVFGIPPEHRLNGYMTHARLYADGNIGEALRMFGGDVQAREFYAKLSRTGEISAYETDPIRAMQRYIKSGMDSQHFTEAYASAKNAAVEEIKQLPAAMQQHVQDVTERYLGDLRGFPGAAEAATQQAVDNLLNNFKIDADVSVRRQIVAAITAIVPAATQGIRVMAGARDFATHMVMYSSRFGYKRMGRAIIAGAKALSGPMREELERIGDITVASPIQFADATESTGTLLAGARGKFARGFDKTTRTMFRLSGQQDIYAMMHAGAYLETREIAAGSLLKLGREEIKWKDVVRETKLDTYDQPVFDQFKSLVMDRKHEEAARFLAIQTGYEQIGVFGLANQPYLWGTNAGRIVGQFGNYAMWMRGNITRMASRGTTGQRIAAMTRLAAGTGAIAMAGDAMGLDLSSWNPIKGMAFAGGPLVDLYETVNDAVGSSGYFADAAKGRLSKMLPWNSIKQVYLPGSYFVDDLVKSIDQFQKGETGKGIAQLGGFHPRPSTGGL